MSEAKEERPHVKTYNINGTSCPACGEVWTEKALPYEKEFSVMPESGMKPQGPFCPHCNQLVSITLLLD